MFIYNSILFFYGLFIQLIAPFHSKAKLWVKGRATIFERLKAGIPPNEKIAWFHVASLGEFEQAKPLLEDFKIRNPEYKILLTFFSPSGYEIRKNYQGADFIFYLPLDTKDNAKKWVEIVQPQIAFFIKYEFWIHYINELHERKIPAYSVSSIFRKQQLYFQPYGSFYANALRKISFFFVQNDESKTLLESIGITTVMVSGDTRFDRVTQNAGSVIHLPTINLFKQNKPLFIAGSTWPKDEALLTEFILKNRTDYKFIIAPHQINENKIEGLIKKLKGKAIRFSKAGNENLSSYQVMIIDNIGMLTSIYQYGDMAYVGGGFGAGIHNILEPSVFMIPVLFGPNYHKFQEASDLLSLKAAFVVNNANELTTIFHQLIKEKQQANPLAIIPPPQFDYFKSKIGATSAILNKLKELEIS